VRPSDGEEQRRMSLDSFLPFVVPADAGESSPSISNTSEDSWMPAFAA